MAKTIDDKNGWATYKDNLISRSGIFDYLGAGVSSDLIPDKVYKVYRSPETLIKAADSFNEIPVLNGHEMIGKGGTPCDKRPSAGVLYNVRVQDGRMLGDLKIYSEDLQNDINNGKRQLSLGYFCNYKVKSGFHNGQIYDAEQMDMVGNHIAFVNRARCGSDVCVQDSVDIVDNKERHLAMDEFDITINTDSMEKKDNTQIAEDEFVDMRSVRDIIARSTLSAEQKKTLFDSLDKAAYKRNSQKEHNEKTKHSIEMPTGKGNDGEPNPNGETVKKEDNKMSEDKGKQGNGEKATADGVDKRKLIDEIGGILKSNGLKDEIIRTIIKKAEEISYSGSEASKVDDEDDKNKKDDKIEPKDDKKDGEKGDDKKDAKDADDKGKEDDKKDEEKKDDKAMDSIDAIVAAAVAKALEAQKAESKKGIAPWTPAMDSHESSSEDVIGKMIFNK